MNEPTLRFTDNQPKTKIKLSTLARGGGKFNKNDVYIESSMRFANGKIGRSYKPVETEEGSLFSYGLHATRYLSISGLSKALRSTSDQGLLEYMVEFTPLPEDSDIPQIRIKKVNHDLMIDKEELESEREVVAWETKRESNTTIFKYDFVTIYVDDIPFDSEKAHCSEEKKLHFKTNIKDDLPTYEEFTVLHDYIDKKTIMHTGDYVKNSCSRLISKLLDITGLGTVIKEWPPSIFTVHDGERFRHAEIRNPDEMRVVYDPFNHGLNVPILKISPTRNKLYVNQLSLSDAMQKPEQITSSPEGLHLDYQFLTVFVRYDNWDENLKYYHGSYIDMGEKD